MAAIDVLGVVCDRLVGGMMFHSDHADLCRFMGFENLAKLHEEGYLHDSKAHARVRRMALVHTETIAPGGRQDRTHTLDRWQGVKRKDVTCEQRKTALCDAMCDWLEWEQSAASVYQTAYRRMLDCGNMTLASLMEELAIDTEKELAHARQMHAEMAASGWDMPYILEMK